MRHCEDKEEQIRSCIFEEQPNWKEKKYYSLQQKNKWILIKGTEETEEKKHHRLVAVTSR